MTDQPHVDDPTAEISADDVASAGLIPDYELPARPLDAASACALAVHDALDQQLAGQSVSVVIDPRPVVDAVLVAAGEWPAIPEWTGDPRRIGGATRAGDTHPEPEIALNSVDGRVLLDLVATVDGTDQRWTMSANATDAEQWFLAGLAAVRHARSAT